MRRRFPLDGFAGGILGYNGALCAIALVRTNIICLVGAVAASLVLTKAFSLAGLPALTAPFVIATWSALALNKLVGKRD